MLVFTYTRVSMNIAIGGDGSVKSMGRLALILGFAATAFGVPAACPTATSSLTRQFSPTGGGSPAPTWTVTAPGASSFNNVANLTTAGTTGCFATDLTFSAFAVSSTNTGTLDTPLPTAAGLYLAQSPNADTLLFSSLQGSGLGGDGALNDGTDNFKVDTTEALATTMSFGVQNSKATGLFGVQLVLDGITVQTGGSGTITIDSCSKGATVITGNITSAGQCTTAGGNVFLSSGPINLIQGQTQTITLSFGATHPTFIDLTEVINLGCTSCGTVETGFLSFSNQFFESPEPSTFGLLGSALAFGAIVLRKRNLRS
jgi:hypothetical protein